MEEKFFVAKVQYDLPDENSGKIKKIIELPEGADQITSIPDGFIPADDFLMGH